MKKSIIDISYQNKLSHLGSVLTACDIIDHIYSIKKPDEKFILSAGHSALGLYVVIEKYEGINAEDIYNHHGTHPDRCSDCHLYCSSGSLGSGFPISIGMALADRTKNYYVLVSDGELSEGSCWESFNVMELLQLTNLHVYINANGYGAYREINIDKLQKTVFAHVPVLKENIHFIRTNINDYPFLKGLDAHYHIITKEEYDAFSLSIQ